MERKTGYYWVKIGTFLVWVIAYYDSSIKKWKACGCSEALSGEQFVEINESMVGEMHK